MGDSATTERKQEEAGERQPRSAMELLEQLQGAAREARKAGNVDFAEQLERRAQTLEDGTLANFLDYEREVQSFRLRDWEAQWKHFRDWQLENQRNVIGLSQAALRGLLLINAGAVVALLAFLGNVWIKGVVMEPFLAAMSVFAAGVVLAVLATALSYLTQLSYGAEGERVKKFAIGLHFVTVMVAFGSMGAFCMGSYRALDAFRQQQALALNQMAPLAAEAPNRDLERRNYPPPKRPPTEPPRPVAPAQPNSPPKAPEG